MKFKKNLIEIMKGAVAVHCDTQEKLKALKEELANHGIITGWVGNSVVYISYYCINNNDILCGESRNFYELNGYTIIEFEELLEDENENDIISHPAHYCHSKYEPKDVIRDWGLKFNLGNVVKYISRAGYKDDIVQDLKKARQYLDFEIEALEAERNN